MRGNAKKWFATWTLASVCSCAASAQTVTIFQSGFEPAENYVVGNLAGQNGWMSHFGEDPNFGEIINTGALAGSQSVLLDGQDVTPGTFGYYAGVVRSAAIAPSLAGKPVRYVETTGLCKILDPTVLASHESVYNVYFWSNTTPFAAVGAGLTNGQYRFGLVVAGSSIAAPPNTTFQFRHLLDYQTGIARAWLNGTLAFQSSSNSAFIDSVHATHFELGGSSNLLPFDTRIWYDDLHIKAIYGCNADVNVDFIVDVADLLAVISAWGACPAPCPQAQCPADVAPVTANGTGNCQVNVGDLLAVIGQWGTCP